MPQSKPGVKGRRPNCRYQCKDCQFYTDDYEDYAQHDCEEDRLEAK